MGAQAGTTNFYVAVYNVLDGNEQNPRIKLFETFGAAVQALLAGDVDMVLMDQASSQGYIGANPDKLKIVGDPLGTEEFGFIFTPESDLVDSFNTAIQTLKDDGFLEPRAHRRAAQGQLPEVPEAYRSLDGGRTFKNMVLEGCKDFLLKCFFSYDLTRTIDPSNILLLLLFLLLFDVSERA